MITVAVCTHQRADSLRDTLESLLQQEGQVEWELLVVDNNSTDHTPAVVAGFADRLPVRRVFEPRQGLSLARNRAVAEARGDLLLFTDDDVVLSPGWLRAFADAAQGAPDAAFFGGRVVPLWTQRPSWMHDDRLALLDGVLVHFDLGDETRPFAAADPLPFGAAFAIRRELAERLGGFRSDLGVVGRRPGRGEESAFLSAALESGARGVYVGRATARHKVDLRRLEPRYLFSYGIESGVSVARTQRAAGGSLVTAALFLVRGVGQLAKGRGDRFRQCIINAGIQVGLRRERRAGLPMAHTDSMRGRA